MSVWVVGVVGGGGVLGGGRGRGFEDTAGGGGDWGGRSVVHGGGAGGGVGEVEEQVCFCFTFGVAGFSGAVAGWRGGAGWRGEYHAWGVVEGVDGEVGFVVVGGGLAGIS